MQQKQTKGLIVLFGDDKIKYLKRKKFIASFRKSVFSYLKEKKCHECKTLAERRSWKIEKWSWKSHGKIIRKVCGNPEVKRLTSLVFQMLNLYIYTRVYIFFPDVEVDVCIA